MSPEVGLLFAFALAVTEAMTAVNGWTQALSRDLLPLLTGLSLILSPLVVVLIWILVRHRAAYRVVSELESRYRGMIEETSDIIHIVSPDGKFLYVNRAWRRTFGYDDEEIERLNLMDLLHPEERAKARRQIGQLMSERTVIEFETRFLSKDGRTVWVEGNSTCELSHGEVVSRRGLFHNVTERKVLSRRGIFHNVTERKEAEADRARLLAILEEAPDFIGTFTPRGKVLWLNRAFRKLRNLEEADLGKFSLVDLHPAWANHLLTAALPSVLSSGIWKGESAVLADGGREVPVSHTIVAHHDESGAVTYLSALCRDITESRRAEAALREAHVQLNQVLQREKELARTDTLTGLANRRAFYEAVQSERARSARYGRPVTLAYIDLDHFKRINDTLGHAVGDELLACVADALRSTLRASDIVGRLGGDEFAVLLPETNATAAEPLLRKLHEILTLAMVAKSWPVTFSLGAATFLDNPPPIEEMIRTADELMYTVKKSGKNRVALVLIGGAARAEAARLREN
jgi:diguanylate cyclase (GGDEF)-like protein/PAS domain S-box-containing protein